MVLRTGSGVAVPQKARYALRALLGLARQGKRTIPIPQLAAEHTIPKEFLQKILVELRQAGIVRSHRGQKGGYTLAREPDLVSVREVLDAIGWGFDLMPCHDDDLNLDRCSDCSYGDNCVIRLTFAQLAREVDLLLGQATLAHPAG
jgi:Rrf2 family protein